MEDCLQCSARCFLISIRFVFDLLQKLNGSFKKIIHAYQKVIEDKIFPAKSIVCGIKG